MARLVEIINILRTEGIAGVWRKFLDYVENLQMTLINGLRDWVTSAIINAGIQILVSFSNAIGALVQILIKIHDLIMFFIENIERNVDFANTIFESLGNIARGNLTAAANYVEDTLSKTIPIIISFLARLLRLPDIAGTIRRIITNLRARVHNAFHRILDFIINKVKKLIARLIARFQRNNGPVMGGINLQGRMHQLHWEKVGRRYQLLIQSEKTELTAAKVEDNKAKVDYALTGAGQMEASTKLAGAKTVLEQNERHQAQISERPPSNSASPEENMARAHVLDNAKAMLEPAHTVQASDNEQDAEEQSEAENASEADAVDPGEPINDKQKKDARSDATEPRFRIIIVPEIKALEGGFGPKGAMAQNRSSLQVELDAQYGDQAKYEVDLDHNPEHAAIWRLGHLKVNRAQRDEGATDEPDGFAFPIIADFFNRERFNNATRPSSTEGQQRELVMAIRYFTHRALGDFQGDVTARFDALTQFSAAEGAFIPKPSADLNALRALGGQMLTGATAHMNDLNGVYQQAEQDKFVHERTHQSVVTNGQRMLQANTNAANNIVLDPSETEGEGPGLQSVVAIRDDPVKAEFAADSDTSLQTKIQSAAPAWGGRVYDRHHLVEKTHLNTMKSQFVGVNIFNKLKNGQFPVNSGALNGAGLADHARTNFEALKAAKPEFASLDTEDHLTRLLRGDGFNAQSVMNDLSTQNQGGAIAVLKQTNNLLGRKAPRQWKTRS